MDDREVPSVERRVKRKHTEEIRPGSPARCRVVGFPADETNRGLIAGEPHEIDRTVCFLRLHNGNKRCMRKLLDVGSLSRLGWNFKVRSYLLWSRCFLFNCREEQSFAIAAKSSSRFNDEINSLLK